MMKQKLMYVCLGYLIPGAMIMALDVIYHTEKTMTKNLILGILFLGLNNGFLILFKKAIQGQPQHLWEWAFESGSIKKFASLVFALATIGAVSGALEVLLLN